LTQIQHVSLFFLNRIYCRYQYRTRHRLILPYIRENVGKCTALIRKDTVKRKKGRPGRVDQRPGPAQHVICLLRSASWARFAACHGPALQRVMGLLLSAPRWSTRTLASGPPSLQAFTSCHLYPRRNTFFKFQCPKLQTDRQTLRWGMAAFKPSQVF